MVFWRAASRAASRLQAVLLGQRCAACDAPCAESPVCPACAHGVTQAAQRTTPCPRCATPQPRHELPASPSPLPLAVTLAFRPAQLTGGGSHDPDKVSSAYLCVACIRNPPSFDAVLALGAYEPPLRGLIAQFKFEQRLVLGAWFAAQLDTVLAGRSFDVITPMALHDNRLRERGYNQAWEIVTRLAHPAAKRHLLTRLRDTPSQRSVSAAQRFANVRGAFAADEPLHGLRVLLVDDVITTTATIEAASKALKAAGASHVSVACLARVSD